MPDFVDCHPLEMGKDELIEAFEGGDMGEVEFFELAMDAGLSIKEAGEVMRRVAQEDYMREFGA